MDFQREPQSKHHIYCCEQEKPYSYKKRETTTIMLFKEKSERTWTFSVSPSQGDFTYLQSMDFQREPQSKHHIYCCEQEKPAHCHGSLLLRLGTHQIQNRTRDAHKISPHGTVTKQTPAMNWDHAVSWGGDLG